MTTQKKAPKGATRVTIMLDSDLSVLLHKLQAKLIGDYSKGVSFSTVINMKLRESLTK